GGAQTLCHVWSAPSWQGFSSRLQAVQPCVQLARHTGPLAIMPSADQVPVKTSHSTMRWHLWVVLIAGSVSSALPLFALPTFTPEVGAMSFTLQVRWVLCSDHLSPSWPMPSSRFCWQARTRQPSWAAAPTMPLARADVSCHGSWHSG